MNVVTTHVYPPHYAAQPGVIVRAIPDERGMVVCNGTWLKVNDLRGQIAWFESGSFFCWLDRVVIQGKDSYRIQIGNDLNKFIPLFATNIEEAMTEFAEIVENLST